MRQTAMDKPGPPLRRGRQMIPQLQRPFGAWENGFETTCVPTAPEVPRQEIRCDPVTMAQAVKGHQVTQSLTCFLIDHVPDFFSSM